MPLKELPELQAHLQERRHGILSDDRVSVSLRTIDTDMPFGKFVDTFNPMVPEALSVLLDPTKPADPEIFDLLPDIFTMDPRVLRVCLADYLLTLEKEGETMKTYTGSGKNIARGVYARRIDYETLQKLSPGVKQAVDAGFKITRMCALMTVKLSPEMSFVGELQGNMLLNEAGFLWASFTHKKGKDAGEKQTYEHYMKHWCTWDVDGLPWDGCNVETPATEAVFHVRLSSDTIQTIDEAGKERAREYQSTKTRHAIRKKLQEEGDEERWEAYEELVQEYDRNIHLKRKGTWPKEKWYNYLDLHNVNQKRRREQFDEGQRESYAAMMRAAQKKMLAKKAATLTEEQMKAWKEARRVQNRSTYHKRKLSPYNRQLLEEGEAQYEALRKEAEAWVASFSSDS